MKTYKRNVIKELKRLSEVSNAVSRDNGVLEIYYKGNETKTQNQVITYLNKKNLWMCFVSIDFIKLETDLNLEGLNEFGKNNTTEFEMKEMRDKEWEKI